MRDAVMGVLLGAAAVILASWYLQRTRGQLLPDITGVLANDCNCGPQANAGYQAAPTRGAAQPPSVLGGEFQ